MKTDVLQRRANTLPCGDTFLEFQTYREFTQTNTARKSISLTNLIDDRRDFLQYQKHGP